MTIRPAQGGGPSIHLPASGAVCSAEDCDDDGVSPAQAGSVTQLYCRGFGGG